MFENIIEESVIMEIIVYFAGPLFPIRGGGSTRMFNVANALAEKVKTYVVALSASNEKKPCHNFIFEGYINSKHDFFNRAIFSMHLFVKPLIILRNILKTPGTKILQVEFIYSIYPAYILKMLSGVPLVVSEHNVEYLAAITKKNSMINIKYTEFLERFFLKRCDHIFCVSDSDKKLLVDNLKIRSEKISVAPNSVDIRKFMAREKQASRDDLGLKADHIIVFVGSLNYKPNIEAIEIISEKIILNVREKYPDSKFIVVGEGNAIHRFDNIHYTGFVDDVVPYICAADVTIAPLISGGGTKLKILEYMACEKPVVTTSKGAEGINVSEGLNIVISDDWDDFSEKIIDLLDNYEFQTFLGKNARKLIEDQYTWEKTAEIYLDVYKKLIK